MKTRYIVLLSALVAIGATACARLIVDPDTGEVGAAFSVPASQARVVEGERIASEAIDALTEGQAQLAASQMKMAEAQEALAEGQAVLAEKLQETAVASQAEAVKLLAKAQELQAEQVKFAADQAAALKKQKEDLLAMQDQANESLLMLLLKNGLVPGGVGALAGGYMGNRKKKPATGATP